MIFFRRLFSSSSSRDFAMSSKIFTHSRLVPAGVYARLHVWEGLPHIFHMAPALPESREVSTLSFASSISG